MSWLAIALSSLCGLAANAQPESRLLWPDPDRFAPTLPCAHDQVVAGADITSVRRATGMDGAVHFAGLSGLDFAVDAGNSAGSVRTVGGRVHAPSGRVSLTEIDLSFPCVGPAWTIGRSYASGVQDVGGARVSPGYQGNNWFASAQPVLVPCRNGSGQVVKLSLVFGADRELRFTRITDGPGAGVFRATDGAAGAIVQVIENEVEYFEFHDAAGTVARFMGQTPTASAPAWHLISMTDAAGASASVQYAGGLPATAIDSAGRTFTYAYTSASGDPRLASVIVQAPGGAEVGRVEYTYAGPNDSRGHPGDLIAVRTRLPVSDQSHTIDRTWHYVYHTTSADAGRLLAKVDPEGAKRAIEDQLDPSLAPAGYRDSAFTYDASGRVATATVREMPQATIRLTYAQRAGASGYDPTWCAATIVHTDTGGCNDLWEALYFDEAEQSLGSFAFDADPSAGTHIGDEGAGAKIIAASWQERNADGVVYQLRDGANLNSYAHLASNGLVFTPDPNLGLIVDRTLITTGLYTGFESQIARRVGDATSASTIISAITYADVDDGEGAQAVSGYLVAAPFVESTTRFPDPASVGETTTSSFTFHAGNGLCVKTVTITDPIIDVGQNGDGSSNSVSYYYGLDGRQRFERTRSGRIHHWSFDATTGQLIRFVWDAAASQINEAIPEGFEITGPADELMRREWHYAYDAQGRRETEVAPDGRASITRVSTFADGRPMVYSVPRVQGAGQESQAFFGPVSFVKLDLEGGLLESVDIGPRVPAEASSSALAVTLTTAKANAEPRTWIGANASSLVEDVSTGFERANLVTHAYDATATFQLHTRAYTQLAEVAASPAPTVPRVVSTLPYDLTRYGYDCTGRSRWTRKPDGTVYTTVRDPLGRTIEIWRGFADGEQDPASPTDPFKLASLDYDQGDAALLNRLTRVVLHPGASEPDRVTVLCYDAQGDVIAVKKPIAPHAVYRRDQLGRPTRVALYGGDGDFLDDPGFNPAVDRVTDRLAVKDLFYDPLGRVYRSKRYAIEPDGMSNPFRTEPTDYFYGKEGSLRLVSADSVTEFGYNRACEICRVRKLAKSANGQPILSVQGFLDSVRVLEDARYLRERTTGNVIGRIDASRDIGLSPYDTQRCAPGGPGALIQEGSIAWNENFTQFAYTLPYPGTGNADYRVSVQSYSYDALGRVVATVDYGDPRMNNSFAAVSGGGMTEVAAAAQALALIQGPDTDDQPRASLFAYDGLGRPLAAIEPDGASNAFRYDALGRAVEETGGQLGDESTPGADASGNQGPQVGMLVINFCPTKPGTQRGFDRGKIIWNKALLPGDPGYPDATRNPEEHWFYSGEDPGTYPSGLMPVDLPSNLPPMPREPIMCRAIADQVPAAWQNPSLTTQDFREATEFTYNAFGQPVGISTTGGTSFSISRDAAGRRVAMTPSFDTSLTSGPTPRLDLAGSLTIRWEYDSLGRLRRVYQFSPATNAPVLDIENTFGSLGELVTQSTTDHANPDPTWAGVGLAPTSQVHHFYAFPDSQQSDFIQRPRRIGTQFPGGLGMKIDYESCPDDERLGRPRRAFHGIWFNNTFTPAAEPQVWRGAYNGVIYPAWDEITRNPYIEIDPTVRDYGPALNMIFPPTWPSDPGRNRFGEITRDWIHQPICAGISCGYPGTATDPLRTPYGNDNTITRGRDGTTRGRISDFPDSDGLLYQPLDCGPETPQPELVGDDDIFHGPVGTLVVRRGDELNPSATNPVRVEHLVRDSSGGLLKHVIEQDIGDGREVLSVYRAIYSSSNRLVAYATKTPPNESTHWTQMPAELDPVADQAIIVRPEYDLRGNLIQDKDNLGRDRRYTYDAFNRLTAVYIDLGTGEGEQHVADWRILAKYRYDALGRRVAAIHNRNDMTTLDDDFVEFFGYDQSWRLTTVWRQAAVGVHGGSGRPAPVIYERILHNPGWGSKLDAPLMSQVNDNWDQFDEFGDPIAPIWDGQGGGGAHFRTFIQDAFGNVIAVRDNTLQRDTVRISYSPTGEPILDSDYSGADFNRDGGLDGTDLASFFTAYEQGDLTADITQDGGIDGADLTLFFGWYETGFMGDHTLNDQRFLYRGYHWDDTLKMYHVRHRVYDPARMLWIQRDPLGRIPGANEYAYCLGEPIDFYDPMGLFSVMRWIYTGDGNASDEVYHGAIEAAAAEIPGWVVDTADAVDTPTGRRVLGVVQVAAGSVAVAGGAATGWTGVGVGVAIVGADMVQAGARQVVTGEWTPTLLQQGVEWGANAAGIHPDDQPLVTGVVVGLAQGAAVGYGGIAIRTSGCATAASHIKGAATRAAQTAGPGKGPVHGTRVHSIFESEVKALGNRSLTTEVSYLNGKVVPRNTPGSVRVDVVEGPLQAPTAIYDLKTGGATLTPARIQQIQSHVPGGGGVPVIEVTP